MMLALNGLHQAYVPDALLGYNLSYIAGVNDFFHHMVWVLVNDDFLALAGR